MDYVAADLAAAFHGRRVLVTGHTGFKGGWLSIWLRRLGAQVFGYSLAPPTSPSFFDLADVAPVIDDYRGDVRDVDGFRSAVDAARPDFIFHLAAQSLVGNGYLDPVTTWSTNVIGTVNLLQAAHEIGRPCAIVVVTSDKCYANKNAASPFRETDALGGADPYSASKAAAEVAVESWRTSYFPSDRGIFVASARAGNVIGGGDWASDRLVPDCVRSFVAHECIELRNPMATRPWQHVLEPVGAYLLLASALNGDRADSYTSSWNFGPDAGDVVPVETVVASFASEWGAEARWRTSPGPHPAEAATLSLNCEKAERELNWQPTWDLGQALRQTAQWYRTWQQSPASLPELTVAQIEAFERERWTNTL